MHHIFKRNGMYSAIATIVREENVRWRKFVRGRCESSSPLALPSTFTWRNSQHNDNAISSSATCSFKFILKVVYKRLPKNMASDEGPGNRTYTKNKKNCSYKGINSVRHVHCPSWRRWLHALIYSRVYDVWETMCMRAAYHVTPQITKGVENVNVLHIGFELLNYLSNNNVWERSERIKLFI